MLAQFNLLGGRNTELGLNETLTGLCLWKYHTGLDASKQVVWECKGVTIVTQLVSD